MKIIRTERKPGCYHQWFEVHCQGGYIFLVRREQASTYEEAIDVFNAYNKDFRKKLIPLYVCNAEPVPDCIALAC